MAFELPQSRRPVRQIQIQKKNVPLEQIIAVRGQSPISTGIEVAGNVIGQALQRRAQLRAQGEQLARQKAQSVQIAKALGLDAKDFGTLSPDQALSVGKYAAEQKQKEQGVGKIRLLEKQGGFAPGALGDDYDAAKLIFTQNSIGGRQERGIESRDDNQFKTRLNNQKARLVNDPRIKPLYAQNIGLTQVGEITDLVKQGNTVAAGALGVKMAKAMGEVGVLTDQDVARYVVSQRLDRMAADKLSRWMRGVPSNATQAEIGQIASVLRDNFSEKIQPIYNEYIESFAEVEGLTPDTVSKKMALPYKPIQLQPLPVPGQETPQQRKARLLQELSGAR